jgi:hypothetical protein
MRYSALAYQIGEGVFGKHERVVKSKLPAGGLERR